MNRKALLIGGPGVKGADGYLRGVERDLEGYRTFLCSPLGGAWQDGEIATFLSPNRAQVDAALRILTTADYSVTLFSGHGRHSAVTQSTIVELQSGIELDSDRLRSGAPKHILILDCCRVEVPEGLEEALAKMDQQGPSLHPDDCRRYYDERIAACDVGLVVLHACSVDETAGEIATRGGIYSIALLGAAEQWWRLSRVDTRNYYDIQSVVSAHDLAVPEVKRLSGNRQNPVIQMPRVKLFFPLAVIT